MWFQRWSWLIRRTVLWCSIAVWYPLASASGGVVQGGEVEARQGYLEPQGYYQGALLDRPPVLTPAQKDEINRWMSLSPLHVETPVDPSAHPELIQPTCPPSVATQSSGSEKRLIPSDFVMFQHSRLSDTATGNMTMTVNEPTVGVNNNVVFYAGNTYASVSTDGGQTFSYIDPRDNFPADGVNDPVNGGFCCDQVVYYAKTQDIMFWGLLYSPDTVSNTVRIAVAPSAASVANNTWFLYNVTPSLFGIPDGRFFDFIDLTASDSSLFLTANIFDISTGVSHGSIIARFPMEQMAQGAVVAFGNLTIPDRVNLRCTQGATDWMYWGTHNSTTSLRIYRWQFGSGTVSWNNVTHLAYATGPISAIGPDGRDWGGRADDRILAAWVADSAIGFMWNSPPAGAFPMPFTEIKIFNQSDFTVKSETAVWGSVTAWLYPSVHPNDRGDLGGTIAAGNTSMYPGTRAWISDSYNSNALAPLENYPLASGTSGPLTNGWGDYLTARRNHPFGNTWSATGFHLAGGPNNADVVPEYVWFGREYDCPSLPPPGNVICSPGPGYIDITWDLVVGNTVYKIYRDGVLLDSTSATTWRDDNPSGNVRCYTVTAQAGPCPPSAQSSSVCCQAFPPSNDDCGNCWFLEGPIADLAFTTHGATTDGTGDPVCDINGDSDIGSDVWFCWTAICNSDVTVSLCGSDFDTKLAVYESGLACPPVSAPLVCNDDWCGVQSEVTFAAVAGMTYLVRAGGFVGAQGHGLLNISISNTQVTCPPGSVPEDEPCGTDVNGGCNSIPEVFGSIFCGVPVCGTMWSDNTMRDTDWYLRTFYSTSTVHWSAQAEMAVQLNIVDITNGCAGSVSLAESSGGPCDVVTVSAVLPPGEYAFFIAPQFDADSLACLSDSMDYVAWLTCNDQCENCLPIYAGGETPVFGTYGATSSGPSEPGCGIDPDITSDIWYCWNAECDGDVTVSLCSSAFDTKLAVYEGGTCPPAGPALACNDDYCDLQSQVTFTATHGQAYLIRVGGFAGAEGTGNISLTYDLPPPNDECGLAIPLIGQVPGEPFSTCGATTDGPDEPVACNFAEYTQIESDIWYLYTATCDGSITASVCDATYDTKMAVYDATPGCPLQAGAITCNDDTCNSQSVINWNATAGDEFLIRVGGFGGWQGSGTLTITAKGTDCCLCPYQGDGDGGGYIDAVDIQYCIDAVFFGGANPQDPNCPMRRMDVDCGGYEDAVDLQYLIDYVFSGGTAPCAPCTGL